MVTDESCYNTKHEKCQELSDDFGIFNDRQQLEKAGPMKPLSLNLQEQKLTADASQNGMDVVSARDDGAEEYIPDDKVENTTKSMARSISQPCIDARTKLNNDHPRPTNVLDLRNDIIDSISPIGRDGLPGLRSIMNGVSTKMNGKRFETIPSRTPLNTIQVTTSRYHPVSRLISSSSSSEGSKFRFDGQVIDNPRSIGSSANFSSMSYHPYYSYTGQQSPIQPPTHQNYVGGTYLNLGTMGQFYSALPRDFGFNPVLVEPLPVSTPINTAGPSSSALPNAASANYYNEDPNAANASAQKKKYVCTICQKRFARPSSLEQHIRAHTGEKPYACNFPGCSKRFSIMSNLRRHHKIHGADAQEYLNQQLSASSGAPRSAAVSSNNTSSDPDFSASGYSPNLASADNNPAANAF